MSRTMTATRFKAECLGILDVVAATGEPVIVPKRGRPVARVVAASAVDPRVRSHLDGLVVGVRRGSSVRPPGVIRARRIG